MIYLQSAHYHTYDVAFYRQLVKGIWMTQTFVISSKRYYHLMSIMFSLRMTRQVEALDMPG